jgi:hypothetical protein
MPVRAKTVLPVRILSEQGGVVEMKITLNKLLLAGTLAVASVLGVFAQDGALSASSPMPASAVSYAARMPFAAGEILTYEGKISRIINGIAVADLTFTLSQPTPGGDYLAKAEARSKGTLLKIFGYSFVQEIESTFGGAGTRVNLTKKHDVQKERVRDSEAVFDYSERRVTYTETDPKEPMRPPRRIASEIVPETHDLVSAIYHLRGLPLKVGAEFNVTVSDSGLVYKVPVKVTGREVQKTVLGQVWCFRVEPSVFGPGRLIEREGSMIIWITDDERRLPIRSQVKSSVGKIEIKLRSAKNVRT